MNNIHNDTVVLVTSYCGGQFSQEKKIMTEVLCSKLKSLGFFVCLATHSSLSDSIQNIVDYYIYDKDNSFNVYGVETTNHGVAEFKSIHNAIDALTRFNFKYVYKIAYDTNPEIDFVNVLEKCKLKNKKLVTARWPSCEPPETIGTHLFFSEIEFFKKTFSFSECYRFVNQVLECAWFSSIFEKQLLSEIFRYLNYEEMLGVLKFEYSHFGGKGISEGYPDSRLPQGSNIIKGDI